MRFSRALLVCLGCLVGEPSTARAQTPVAPAAPPPPPSALSPQPPAALEPTGERGQWVKTDDSGWILGTRGQHDVRGRRRAVCLPLHAALWVDLVCLSVGDGAVRVWRVGSSPVAIRLPRVGLWRDGLGVAWRYVERRALSRRRLARWRRSRSAERGASAWRPRWTAMTWRIVVAPRDGRRIRSATNE